MRNVRYTLKEAEVAFWKKVEKTEGCWIWTANRDKNGYGTVKFNGKNKRATRMAWWLTFGEEPPQHLWALHRCDNPSCVRPDHLFLGTPSQNSIDRERKKRGRPLVGSKNGHNKLDESIVQEILAMLASGMTARSIAKKYDVDPATICYIKRGKTWRHVISPHYPRRNV